MSAKHYLLTALAPNGDYVQLSVGIDPTDKVAAQAVECCTNARARLWWRGYLGAAGHTIERVLSVKALAGHVAARGSGA